MKKLILIISVIFFNVNAFSQNVVCNKTFNQHNSSRQIVLENGDVVTFAANCYDTVTINTADGEPTTKLTERYTGKAVLLNDAKIYDGYDNLYTNHFIKADTSLSFYINNQGKKYDKKMPNGHYTMKIAKIIVNKEGKIVFCSEISYDCDYLKNKNDAYAFEKIRSKTIQHLEKALQKITLPVLQTDEGPMPYMISYNSNTSIGH